MQSLRALPFVGGDPALDFTNTAEERGHPLCGDVLHTAEDLRVWGGRYGVLDKAASSRDPERELARALDARELLYRLWLSRVHAGDASPGDLEQLAELAAEAYGAASLMPDTDQRVAWRWRRDDLASVRHLAVVSAVDLLGNLVTRQLKQCPGDHCGWFFLDTTKRGNRRWCQMSECGQAAKNAQRRQRRTP